MKKEIKLRKYQESIVATSTEKNTLVVLPTGMGKTIIAITVAVIRLSKFPNGKVLFLAPTKPLVMQHYQTFREYLNLKDEEISAFTGAINQKKRSELWKNSKIIVATPQTIENEIMKGLNLEDVVFLVFDEAHRAVGNYAYSYISSEYIKKAKNPLIMGLTASPSSDVEKILEISKNLSIENVEIRTENDPDVAEYIQPIKIRWIKVELPEKFLNVRKKMISLLQEYLQQLKILKYIDTIDVTKISRKYLLETQEKIREDALRNEENAYNALSIIAKAIKLDYAIELIETQGIYTLYNYFERLKLQKEKGAKELVNNEKFKEIFKDVNDLKNLNVDHPKLNKLEEILNEILKDKNLKILIFTQYRDTAEKIYQILNNKKFSVSKFIGQADKGQSKGMTQNEQIEILEKFRNNVFNVLIA
ncbi:MAG: DEAD/DEAH box helicase, partial [Candidatus Altarchaeaceae archaeon]